MCHDEPCCCLPCTIAVRFPFLSKRIPTLKSPLKKKNADLSAKFIEPSPDPRFAPTALRVTTASQQWHPTRVLPNDRAMTADRLLALRNVSAW